MQNKYYRKFVLLEQDNSLKTNNSKSAMGKCLIEAKSGLTKFTAKIQNSKPNSKYELVIVVANDRNVLCVKAGSFFTDNVGNGELKCESSSKDIFQSNININEFNTILVGQFINSIFTATMFGYFDERTQWKNRLTFVDKPIEKESYKEIIKNYTPDVKKEIIIEENKTYEDDDEEYKQEILEEVENIEELEIENLKTKNLERIEIEKLENERLEKEKFENERLEKEKLENENLEHERLEKERFENKNLEHERLEKERFEHERLEQERFEHERLEQERLEHERSEHERLEHERLEQERLEHESSEHKRLEQERHEHERSEHERLEHERLEQERLEQKQLEQERLEHEKLEQEEFEQQIIQTQELEYKRLEEQRLKQQKRKERTEHNTYNQFKDENNTTYNYNSKKVDHKQNNSNNTKLKPDQNENEYIKQSDDNLSFKNTFKKMIDKFQNDLVELNTYSKMDFKNYEDESINNEINLSDLVELDEKEKKQILHENKKAIDKLFRENEKVTPFKYQTRDVSWVYICLEDLAVLPFNYMKYINNSFFTTKYFARKKLILGEYDYNNEKRYVLGLPDNYNNSYKLIASKLNFYQFKPINDKKLESEVEGYWLLIL